LQGLSLVAIVGRVGIPMERAGWGRVGNMGDLDWGDFDLGRVDSKPLAHASKRGWHRATS